MKKHSHYLLQLLCDIRCLVIGDARNRSVDFSVEVPSICLDDSNKRKNYISELYKFLFSTPACVHTRAFTLLTYLIYLNNLTSRGHARAAIVTYRCIMCFSGVLSFSRLRRQRIPPSPVLSAFSLRLRLFFFRIPR